MNQVRDYFSIIDLFRGFNAFQLTALEKHCKVVQIPGGDVILSQGDLNKSLYVLLSGKLGVRVDGNNVAAMDSMGEIIGEMSVVTGAPISATILAETDAKLIEIDLLALNLTLGDKKEEFNSALFKAFAVSLADKLRTTNQKAKYFEDVSDKHLSEIYRGQKIALKRLQDVTSQYLPQLKSNLTKIEDQSSNRISESLGQIELIEKNLEPIVSSFNASLLKKNKKVLLAESNKREQSIAKMALGGTGIELDIASHINEARELIATHSYDIVFVSIEMIEIISMPAEGQNSQYALMISEALRDHIPRLRALKQLPNIVSRDSSDRLFTSKNIVTTVSKLAGKDIFGLGKYLAWGVDLQSHEVTGSEMRKNLNMHMRHYFEKLGVRSSRLDSISTVAEELLMNAIYDAPTDKNGKPIYNHLDRSTHSIELHKDQFGKFSYGTDGVLIGISVEDPYGALNGHTVINYLDSCYSGAAGSLNTEKGGAGRGLHMIIELSDFVVFNIKKGVRTEIIALFHLDNKSSMERATNFHYFYEV